MRRHVVLPTTWACCMGDVQEFDVELRAPREFFLTLGYGPIEYVLWAGFAVAVLPTVMVLRAL